MIKDLLFYKIIYIEDLDFQLAPVNILFLLVLFWLRRILNRMIKKWTNHLAEKTPLVKLRSDALYRLSRNLLIILTIILAVQSFNINNDQINFAAILDYKILRINKFSLTMFNILFAFAMYFITRVGLNIFQLYLNRNLSKKSWVDEGRKFTIFQLVKYFAYIIATMMIIRSTGIEMSLLITSAAALFVGVGLGLQTIFADLVSGFILLFDGSVKVGDVIEVNNEPHYVQKITIRYTLVETLDESVTLIPNSKLTTVQVLNRQNQNIYTRYTIRLTVAYGSDIEKVNIILFESAHGHKNVSHTKKPKVFLEDFGDNGTIMELHFWMNKDMLSSRTRSDIRYEIEKRFRENGIVIAVPQREVSVKSGRMELPRKTDIENSGK